MEYATFRKWLAEHGYRLDTQSEKRGEGHGTVTIHRAGRTAELPLVGARHNLDRVRFAKSAKHSASIGPNFLDRRAASEATSVGSLFIILKTQARCLHLTQSRRDTRRANVRFRG